MNSEGHLDIRLQGSATGIEVSISSSRPVQLTRLFVGQTPAQVLRQIPLLYSVCATAQTAAAVAALRQSCPDATTPITTDLASLESLVWIETAREHLWRILIDWPQFLQRSAPTDAMRLAGQLPNEARDAAAACANPDWTAQIGSRLEALLQQWILGEAPNDWLNRAESNAFESWLHQREAPLAAAMLRELDARGWAALGVFAPRPLGRPDLAELNHRLSGDCRQFLAAPVWDGSPRETSSFTRELAHPLVRLAAARWGEGLAARLIARLVELASISSGKLSKEPVPDATIQAGQPAQHTGIACVEAARGLLTHRVELDHGRVCSYAILAPTEWNFHPQGAMGLALSGLPRAAPDTIRHQAELLIGAIDPCVSFNLDLADGFAR